MTLSTYWIVMHGDAPEDGKRVQAYDAEAAVTAAAAAIDADGDYPVLESGARGCLLDVYEGNPLRRIGTWRVYGEAVPQYSASEQLVEAQEAHCDNTGRCVPMGTPTCGCRYCGKELVPGPQPGCAFTWDHYLHDEPMCQTHDRTSCPRPPR